MNDVFNAIWVWSDEAGETVFYGRGAGGTPTASAIIGAIVRLTKNRERGISYARSRSFQPPNRQEQPGSPFRYCLRLRLATRVPDARELDRIMQQAAAAAESVSPHVNPDGSRELVVETGPMSEQAIEQLRATCQQAAFVQQVLSLILNLDL